MNLHGFDLEGWNRADYTIDIVEVEGDAGTLFAATDSPIAGAGPNHTDFDFSMPIVSPTITVRFDSTNLGSFSDNIGVDNMTFSQSEAAVIPVPGALSLLALALAGLGVTAWRGRR